MTGRLYRDDATGEWVAVAPRTGLEGRAKEPPGFGPDKRPTICQVSDAQNEARDALARALAEAAGVGGRVRSWDRSCWHDAGAQAGDGPIFRAEGRERALDSLIDWLDLRAARHVGTGGGGE